jgi:hypothetical protein
MGLLYLFLNVILGYEKGELVMLKIRNKGTGFLLLRKQFFLKIFRTGSGNILPLVDNTHAVGSCDRHNEMLANSLFSVNQLRL